MKNSRKRKRDKSSELTIRIDYGDPAKARAVLDSVEPDNKPLPTGLRLDAVVEGPVLAVRIDSLRPLKSLLRTADDLLSMIVLAEKTLNAARKSSSDV